MKNNRFMSYGIYTLLTIALSAAYCFIGGFLGMVIGILISALLGVVYYHEHYSFGMFNSMLLLTVITLFYDPLQMLYVGLPIILLAISLTLGTRLKLKLHHLLLICTALFLAEFLVGMELIRQLSDQSVTLSSMMLDVGRELQAVMLEQNPDPTLSSQIEATIQMTVDLFIMLSPAMFTIVSTVLSFVLVLVYKKMQQKRDVDMSFLTSFDMLQSDQALAVIFLILIFLLGAAPEGLFYDAAVNVCVILSFLFMVLGMSVFDCKLKHAGMKKIRRRLLLFALAISSTMFLMAPMIILMGCGLLDSFFDFRRLRSDGNRKQI